MTLATLATSSKSNLNRTVLPSPVPTASVVDVAVMNPLLLKVRSARPRGVQVSLKLENFAESIRRKTW